MSGATILWILSALGAEPGFGFIFLLAPLCCLFKSARERIKAFGILSAGVLFYLTLYLQLGRGAKSATYLDPVSSFSGYLERFFLFFPDYFVKKMTFDRLTYFDPLQPAFKYWLFLVAFIILGLWIDRRNQRYDLFSKPFSILMLSTFLHPILLVTTIVSSRSLFILSLTFNFFILSIVAWALRWEKTWSRWAVLGLFGVLLMFGYRMSVQFTDRDPFFLETADCIQNLKEYESQQVKTGGQKFYSLNDLPVAYHWTISNTVKFLIEGQPLTDNRAEDLDLSWSDAKTLRISSRNSKGLVEISQTYLYGQEFFRKNSFHTSEAEINVLERVPSGMPKAIAVTFIKPLKESHFILWDKRCHALAQIGEPSN
jgi:hypothetical protein